jgi:hypothetical protein
MQRDFFDPPANELRIVGIGAATLHRAQQQIESCEHCHNDEAEIPFDWILDRVTGLLVARQPIIF